MNWKPVYMLGLAALGIGCAPDPAGPDDSSGPAVVGPSYAYAGNTASFSSTWLQGFEVDAIDWTATSRVPSGTNGVASASGAFHGEAASGAFTRFNAYSAVWPGDYITEIDIYLDPAWAAGQGFDYSVASSNSAGGHRRDFIFHIGVTPSNGLRVNADNNSYGSVNAFILNAAGSVEITTAGWHKLRHVFYDDAGILTVDLQLLNSAGSMLFTTTRQDASDLIGSIGGNRHGWFVFSTRTLAIDNHRRATAAPQSPSTLALTITPSSPVFGAGGNHVVGVAGDAASGFSSGSFASDGSDKTDMYFTPEALFAGREVSVGEVARMSYWTKKGTTHAMSPADWYMVIYTKPFTGDVSTPTWYGSRFGAEPYFSANIQDPAGSWNLWSTNLASNTLRFFESTAGAPGANFGAYTDPPWAEFIGSPSFGTSVRRASQKVLSFSIQTASAWASGFTGQVDGFRIELTDGSVATINFEPDPLPDTEAPVVTNVVISPNPAPVTTASYALTATATDNVAVTGASYTVNGGAPVAFTFAPGSPVSLAASLGALSVGVHEVCVTATDAAPNVSAAECTMLAVYDPDAGFVTGGGWITSPEGALAADPLLTGKATFGFVSKYVKGKALPTGNTEFQFKAGGLNFSSTSYEWLVVSGARAQFRGAGTINGGGDYRFVLTAIDGQVSGGGGVDRFRIRIWNNDGGGLVYDNQLSAPDSATPTTALGGGSIMIQTKK